MSIENSGQGGHPPLAPEIADKLLDLLSSDDQFRQLFASNPEGALQSVGLAPLQSEAALTGGSCLNVSLLASKEELQASRDVLRDYFTSAGTHTVVFVLEFGHVQATAAGAVGPGGTIGSGGGTLS
ncbi:NHLP-related RiPP peptide [Lysobacter firmicutimachus]|uniref:NHLP-related RiPP peptide n=1 Tax=Lysobacter firmicutimachus TaxID=1792846 RepID=A0AAU8MUV5_9GAMM